MDPTPKQDPPRPVFLETQGRDTPTVQLVMRAKDGDADALNDLLERYRDRLHRIARIRVSADLRRSFDVSDVLQNALLVACKNLQSFEPRDDASVIQWLSRILENQIRDAAKYYHAQKRDTRRDVSLDGDASVSTSGFVHQLPDSSAATPSEIVSKTELTELYDACVEELSPDHREAVLLRDYAGGSWEFVGQQMGRSPEAVRELHRRAQVKLSRMLASRVSQS